MKKHLLLVAGITLGVVALAQTTHTYYVIDQEPTQGANASQTVSAFEGDMVRIINNIGNNGNFVIDDSSTPTQENAWSIAHGGVIHEKTISSSDPSYHCINVASNGDQYYDPWVFGEICVSKTSVSIGENEAIETMIYPNPAKEVVHLLVSNPEAIESIRIIDLTGKIVLVENSVTFDISNLSNGTYFIQIDTGEEVVTQKLIKTN